MNIANIWNSINNLLYNKVLTQSITMYHLESDLKKAKSFENMQDSAADAASVYRNPARDELGDEQSLLDRNSFAASTRYEGDNYPDNLDQINTNMPPMPRRERVTIQRGAALKPNRYAVYIEKYDGLDEVESFDEWIIKYELMADSNNWNDELKKKYLVFNMEKAPYDYCLHILSENPTITYTDLKTKLADLLVNKFNAPIHFHNLSNLKFNRGDNFLAFWSNKLALLKRVDKNMSFESQQNMIIDSLYPELYKDVLKNNSMNKPKNLEDLFHAINNMYQIEISSKNQKDINQKTVRFEESTLTKKKNVIPSGSNTQAKTYNQSQENAERRSNYNSTNNNQFQGGNDYNNRDGFNSRGVFNNYGRGYSSNNNYNRGGYNNRGGYGFANNRGYYNRGGYQQNQSFNNRGGYQQNQGYNNNRGGYQQNRGSNNQSRNFGRNNYRNNGGRTNFESGRTFYNNNRNYGNNPNTGDERQINYENDQQTFNNDTQNNGTGDASIYTRSPTNGPLCFYCNKYGHTQYSCPVKQRDLQNTQQTGN